MKNITQNLKLIALAIILSFGISFASAWVLPTAAPPNGNADAPITTGKTPQEKHGSLTLRQLSPADPIPVLTVPALKIPGSTVGQVLTATDATGNMGWATSFVSTASDLDTVLGAGSTATGKNISLSASSGAGGVLSAGTGVSTLGYISGGSASVSGAVTAGSITATGAVTGSSGKFRTVDFGGSYGPGTGFVIKEVGHSETWLFRCQVRRGAPTSTLYVSGYDKAPTYDSDGELASPSCNWHNSTASFPPWPTPCGGVGTMGGAPSPFQINNIMDRYGWDKGLGKIKLRTEIFSPTFAGVSGQNLCGSGGHDGTQGYLILNYVTVEAQ